MPKSKKSRAAWEAEPQASSYRETTLPLETTSCTKKILLSLSSFHPSTHSMPKTKWRRAVEEAKPQASSYRETSLTLEAQPTQPQSDVISVLLPTLAALQ